jgi:hypothetical protein
MALGDVAAKLNVPVFPCGDNKRPITENGFKNAATDHARIMAMFERPGAALIGMPTGSISGLVVVDIDIRSDRTGMDWLNLNADALPETRTHKTRSGGLHLVFRAPLDVRIRNSAGRLAPGVDVRGEGGYVILPPSPGYEIADATDPAEMPLWLINACVPPQTAQPVAERKAPRADGGSAYGLAALAKECDAIRSARWGEQETTLNSAGLKIGALVAGGELQEGIATAELRSAGSAMSSEPNREPWRPDDVDAKVRRAIQHGMQTPRQAPPPRERIEEEPPDWHSDPGYLASLDQHAHLESADVEQIAEDVARDIKNDAAAAERARLKRAYTESQAQPLPLLWFNEIQPVLDAKDFVQGVLIEEGAVVVYGESNAGKTFWATDLALHVAAGDPWRKRRVEQSGVIYCVLEGGNGFRNRVSAWKSERGLDDTRLPFAAIPSSLNLLNPDADTPRLIAAIKAAAAMIAVPVRLVVVDTLARAMAGGNENAPDDMGALVLNMDAIRAATKTCVMFIHHSGKDQAKGARGHSSLRAAIDTEIEVVAEEASEAKTATVVKQREMKKGDVFPFTLRVIELGANQHDEVVTTCLVDYGVDQAPGGASDRSRRLRGHTKRALEVLADLVNTSGQSGHIGTPAGALSVPDKWWRERFYERAMPGAEPEARKKAFQRASMDLLNAHRVGFEKGRVWIPGIDQKQPEQPVMEEE